MAGKHRKPSNNTAGRFVAVAAGSGAIALMAPGHAAAAPDWDRLAGCESSGDWNINTGNGFYGGVQFAQSTWEEFGGTAFAARADLATKAQQIEIAAKVLAVQGPGAWPDCSHNRVPGWWEGGAPESAPVDQPAPNTGGSTLNCLLTQGFHGGHNGIDIGCPIGTPIRSVGYGDVLAAGDSGEGGGGYGNWIRVQLDSGEIVEYGHINEWYVYAGQRVSPGEVIGATGNAGTSTGPHLHFRVLSGGGGVDPLGWLGGQWDSLVGSGPLSAPVVDVAPLPVGEHTVVSGDTLSAIAAAHGLSWEEVWGINRDVVDDPNLIYPGEVLRLT